MAVSLTATSSTVPMLASGAALYDSPVNMAQSFSVANCMRATSESDVGSPRLRPSKRWIAERPPNRHPA
jgi:hypothetical protein